MSLPSNQLSNISFNNFVVKRRGKVKQVLVRLCHKITREINKYQNFKSESEELKNKKKRKANRLRKEMKIMKKLEKDDVTKFVLQFDRKPDAILNDTKANIKLKLLVKFSQNKILKDEVETFRRKYPNWKVEIPSIIRNVQLKKKGMQLNENIAKGEADRMKKLDKYPSASNLMNNTKESVTKSSKDKTKKNESNVLTKSHKTKKLSKTKMNGSMDSLNSWNVESSSKKGLKVKADQVKLKKRKKVSSCGTGEDSEAEIEKELRESEEETELDDDTEEDNKLALKLSSALRKITPRFDDSDINSEEEEEVERDTVSDDSEGSVELCEDEFVEERRKMERMKQISKKKTHTEAVVKNGDSSEEDEDESSEDEFEQERRKRKLQLIKESSNKKEILTNEHSREENESEEEDEEESSEDEIEQERKKIKLELIEQNSDKKKTLNNQDSSEEIESEEEDDEESSEDALEQTRNKTKIKLSKQNGMQRKELAERESDDSSNEDTNESKMKNNLVKNVGKNKTSDAKSNSNDEVRGLKKSKVDMKALSKHLRESGKQAQNHTGKQTNERQQIKKEAPVERVVDEFFMTKDNREYLSSVKPNAVPEPSDREADQFKPRPQFIDTKPKEIYRKGKKVVVGKNRASFSNFEGGKNSRLGSLNERPNHRPFGEKFNSEKADRVGGSGRDFHGNSGPRFSNKFDRAPQPGAGATEKLHPSWEAKKRHQPAITHFKGKKIRFDE